MKFFKNPPPSNCISFKKAKAKCKIIIKQVKSSSWRNYVFKINSHTYIKSVWKKIRKIKGKENIPKVHLKKDANLISDPKEQANYLAESFFLILLPKLFQIFRENQNCKEQNPIDFSSDNSELQ